MKPWVYLQTLSYENQHNVTQSFLILKLPCTKSVVGVLEFGFLACPTKIIGPT